MSSPRVKKPAELGTSFCEKMGFQAVLGLVSFEKPNNGMKTEVSVS